jgi:hypothetical protein
MAGQEHTQPRAAFRTTGRWSEATQCSGSVDERGYTLRSLRPASRGQRQVADFLTFRDDFPDWWASSFALRATARQTGCLRTGTAPRTER